MDKEYRILIVEDSPSDAALNERQVCKALKRCVFSVVETREAFLQALEQFQPDAILSDYSLPHFDGFEALKLTLEKAPLTPFLIVTGSMNEDTAVECLKAGAADYIIKEHIKRLGSALSNALRQKESRIRHYNTQLALLENEERFRRLAENAVDLIFRYELLPVRGFTYVSPSSTSITGYTPEEHYADPDLGVKIVHPDDRAELEKFFNHEWQFGAPLALRWLRKDGTVIWIEQRNVPVYDAGGRLKAIEGIARDITDRKRAEQALRESEERYRTFFENDLAGDFITGADGRIIECNRSFARILGYETTGELLKLNMFQLCRSAGQIEEFLRRIAGGRPVEYFKIELLHRNGRPVNVAANAFGTFNRRGELVGIVGYLLDETRLRQLELQLIQAQKLESLGTLAGGVAHDFNNILSIILGHLQLLEESCSEGEKFSKTVQVIRQAASRGVSLVKQLFTFARKTESTFEPVSINAILEEVAKLLRGTFPKTIAISLNLADEIPAIAADASQIHQVLLNISVNARDAMPEGGTLAMTSNSIDGGALTVRFPNANAGRYVVIRMCDTGTGMDEDTKKRMFEPFFTTKAPEKGTGLGLAMVYGIIENHQGFIEIESERGHGTTFAIYLPAREIPVNKDLPAAENIRDIPGGCETILLIEDEETLREYLHTALNSKGYNVLVAGDGEEGLEIFRLRQNTVDLVISDIGLPKMDGGEVFKRIKASRPNVKVILTSDFIDPDVKSWMREAGAEYFINKPFSPGTVLKTIRRVLDERKSDG